MADRSLPGKRRQWVCGRRPRAGGLLALSLMLALGAAACGSPGTSGETATPGNTSATSVPTTPITRFPITAAGLGCIQGAQESPDGKTIAVVATTNDCATPAAPSDTTKLVLLDAGTGKPSQTIDLAREIMAKAQLPAGLKLMSVIVGYGSGYTDWLWSGDSQRLAFFAFGPTNDTTGDHTEWQGAAIVDPSTQSVQVIEASGPPTAAQTGPLSSYTPVGAWIVNMRASTMTWAQVPQALGYAWQGNGPLTVQTPIPASPNAIPTPSAGGAVGSAYGASFSVWQAATVDYTQPDCFPPYFSLNFSRPAWSPDGYVLLTPGIQTMARLDSPVPPLAKPTPGGYTPDCSAQGSNGPDSPADLARLAPRDAGMRGALSLIQKDPAYPVAPSPEGMQFEWSPDGARVAVTTTNPPTGPNPQVAVYDCASGKQVIAYSITHLDLAYAVNTTDPERNILGAQWSPDGKSLMVYDGNAVVLLGEEALGK